MKRIIFFDIDGVLNTERMWQRPYQLLKEKVELLARLAIDLNATLVMTSTWKNGYKPDIEECTPQIKTLRSYLSEYSTDIYDATPNLMNRSRDKEIERYLYFHPCDKYIILDDDESLFENKKNLYLINSLVGLTEKDIKKIKKELL